MYLIVDGVLWYLTVVGVGLYLMVDGVLWYLIVDGVL